MQAPGRNDLLLKIALWQQQVREHMTDQIEAARTRHSVGPLILLTAMAVVYGMVHAAGPGHGKAVALSYMLSRRANIFDAVLFGNLVAVFHGLSGIGLVLVVKWILAGSVAGTLADVTRVTQLVSFSLILGLGAAIFLLSLKRWLNKGQSETGDQSAFIKRQTGLLITAAAVGMVPCPGVVMVMLFALSLELVGLGILLGLAITLGMALTITLIVLVAVYGKKLSLGIVKLGPRFDHAIQTLAGFAVALLGGVLLLATLKGL